MRTSATLVLLVLSFIAVNYVLGAIPNDPKGVHPHRPKGPKRHKGPKRPKGPMPVGPIPVQHGGAMPAQPNNPGADQLLDESCKRVSAFDRRIPVQYCISAVNKAPFDHKAPMTPEQLASHTLDLLAVHVSMTRAKVLAIAGPGQKDPALKDAGDRCLASYNEATHRIESSQKLFRERNFVEADRKVSMVQGDGSNCEHQFQIHKVGSPITEDNRQTEFLSGMGCLFIRYFANTLTPAGLHPH